MLLSRGHKLGGKKQAQQFVWEFDIKIQTVTNDYVSETTMPSEIKFYLWSQGVKGLNVCADGSYPLIMMAVRAVNSV